MMEGKDDLPPPYEEIDKPNAPPLTSAAYDSATSSSVHHVGPPQTQTIQQDLLFQPRKGTGGVLLNETRTFPPQPGQPGQPVVNHIVTVIPTGPESILMTCPFCKAQINTAIKKMPSMNAFLSSAVILLCGFWCGCCLIPFCLDSCYNTRHTCPSCKSFIAMHTP